MKVLISVDMEGISGIVLPGQVGSEAHYAEARKFMTADANACAEGCFRGGAKEVVVWDAHWQGFNIYWDQLDSRVVLQQGGSDLGRMYDIQRFDALILLGYHSMAGTRCGVLEHTMSSASWQNFWMNGRKAGEIAIDAAIAGDSGVPTIMVSGDDKACKEAKSWIDGVYTAQVKEGLSSTGARLLSRETAHKLITETAEKACRDYKKMKPLVVKKPVKMRLEVVERHKIQGLDGGKPWLKLIDGRTYEVTGENALEALSRL
jgi:D-amino peptidase